MTFASRVILTSDQVVEVMGNAVNEGGPVHVNRLGEFDQDFSRFLPVKAEAGHRQDSLQDGAAVADTVDAGADVLDGQGLVLVVARLQP